MTPAFLEADRLVRRFGAFTAVDAASLRIGQGELHAVIGPNGAGKTTLFNLLTGDLRCQGGAIRLEGKDVTRLPPHRRARAGFGRTFQINTVFGSRTVFENIQVAALASRSRIWSLWCDRGGELRAEVDEAASKVGLRERLRVPALELSYGDRRKLELAIALATRPRLLLLDEPTCGMALDERPRMIELVRRLVDEEGVTAILVEHDMDIVFAAADRITVMNRGRIIARGTPKEIERDPEVRRIYLGDAGHA